MNGLVPTGKVNDRVVVELRNVAENTVKRLEMIEFDDEDVSANEAYDDEAYVFLRMWNVDEALENIPAVLNSMVEVAFQLVAGVYGHPNVAHVAHERVEPENESGEDTVVL